MHTPTTIVLQQRDIDRAAEVMANAFRADPLAEYLLPDVRRRLDGMVWLWGETTLALKF